MDDRLCHGEHSRCSCKARVLNGFQTLQPLLCCLQLVQSALWLAPKRLQCTAPLRLVRRFCVHLRRPPLVSVELCEFPYLLSLHCLLKTYHGGIPADRCVFGAQIMLLYVIRGHNTNPWDGQCRSAAGQCEGRHLSGCAPAARACAQNTSVVSASQHVTWQRLPPHHNVKPLHCYLAGPSPRCPSCLSSSPSFHLIVSLVTPACTNCLIASRSPD